MVRCWPSARDGRGQAGLDWRCHAGRPAVRSGISPKARRSAEIRRAGGHRKSELGPAARRLAHGDGAAVRLDKSLDDEQAEASAATALRAPELPEHPGRELGRDALALVPD